MCLPSLIGNSAFLHVRYENPRIDITREWIIHGLLVLSGHLVLPIYFGNTCSNRYRENGSGTGSIHVSLSCFLKSQLRRILKFTQVFFFLKKLKEPVKFFPGMFRKMKISLYDN